jgi:ubiquinone/menaquinone biosynthesis C-methylase UbiE
MPAALSPLEAYRRWAPTWETDPSPIVALESRYLAPWLTVLAGKVVADLSCGVGRWLAYAQAQGANVLGFDLCREMLLEARKKPGVGACLALADTCRLPLADSCVDVAICALSLGHMPDLDSAVAELARIVRPGGAAVFSDFHPDAIRRGWKRTFRSEGQSYEIVTYPYTTARLIDCASHGGLVLQDLIEPCFGEPEQSIFERAGKPELFEQARGIPAVLVARWTRT